MPAATCADNLARLIEMLAAAAEYADRCGGTLGEECLIDVEGAAANGERAGPASRAGVETRRFGGAS